MAAIDPNDDGSAQLKATASQLDQQRLDSLNDAILVGSIRNATMTSEIARLTKKYGSTDARVQVLMARVAQYPAQAQAMNAEVTRAASTTPTVTADKWLIQGHVYGGSATTPVPGVTVYFFNANDAGLPVLGYVCTDKAGFYFVEGTEEVLRQLGDQKFFLGVSDRNQKVLYRGTTAISLKVGTTTYQNVYLTTGNCSAPPHSAQQ